MRGIAAAGKRAASSRVAAEGLLMLARTPAGGGGAAPEAAAVAELNCETDFVARNAKFQGVLGRFAGAALEAAASGGPGGGGGGCAVREDLLAANGGELRARVRPMCEELSASVREKVEARRAKALIVGGGGLLGSYVHAGGGLPAGMGRIGAAVCLLPTGEGGGGAGTEADLRALAASIAMHVAGMRPRYLAPGDVPERELEGERAVLTAQARAEGKPDKVVAKMVEGRLRKMFDDVCLSRQRLVTDPDTTVEDAVRAASGGAYRLGAFLRMEVGEGVDKGDQERDFAEEVKEQVQKASS